MKKLLVALTATIVASAVPSKAQDQTSRRR